MDLGRADYTNNQRLYEIDINITEAEIELIQNLIREELRDLGFNQNEIEERLMPILIDNNDNPYVRDDNQRYQLQENYLRIIIRVRNALRDELGVIQEEADKENQPPLNTMNNRRFDGHDRGRPRRPFGNLHNFN